MSFSKTLAAGILLFLLAAGTAFGEARAHVHGCIERAQVTDTETYKFLVDKNAVDNCMSAVGHDATLVIPDGKNGISCVSLGEVSGTGSFPACSFGRSLWTLAYKQENGPSSGSVDTEWTGKAFVWRSKVSRINGNGETKVSLCKRDVQCNQSAVEFYNGHDVYIVFRP